MPSNHIFGCTYSYGWIEKVHARVELKTKEVQLEKA